MKKPANFPDVNVLALDPGKMSGIAFYSGSGTIQAYEANFYKAAKALEWLIPMCELVTVERFTIGVNTGKMRDNNWSLELIGVARWYCLKHDVNLLFQGPAEAKQFMSNDKLKALGLHKATVGGHQNDAVRHLILALLGYTTWWDPRLASVLSQ